jgi:hypothetical protein
MSRKILMTFLIPIILLHEMEIITTILSTIHIERRMRGDVPNDDSTMHFSRDHNSRENTTTNRNLTSERTFLVYTVSNLWMQGVPIYVPSMASFGVLKPRPTSLYHLFDFVFPAVFGFWKM